MVKAEYFFVGNGVLDKLSAIVEKYGNEEYSPEKFMMKIKELLPVHKTNKETWKARVEGFNHVSDDLINLIIKKVNDVKGKTWDKEDVVQQAKLRPLSYYHYVTGSREPVSNMMSQDDYFVDPTTSLVKLEDDIVSMCKLYVTF
jgi:hypothetical protein